MDKIPVYELNKKDYGLILQNFNLDKCTLAVKSVLCNHTPGIVLVDSEVDPKTVFIWDKCHDFFILGEKGNKEYCENLREKIYGDIFKQAKEKEDLLDFYVRPFYSNLDTNDKNKKIIDDLFKNNSLMLHKRRHYSLELSEYNIKRPQNIDIDNAKIEFIDKLFLTRTQLENFDEITNWIEDSWISEELFLQEGFGFCLVVDESIVSWCISDYRIDVECEIGIETDERYRNKGYATILVTEVVNYCKQKGFVKIGWHCRDNNIGSYKVAEKVGFKDMNIYYSYHAWFNVFDNFLVNGQYFLTQTQDYRKAAECYEKAFEMKNSNDSYFHDSSIFSQDANIKWCYYNTACAWALAGEHEDAFSNLEKAVEAGWNDANMLEKDERLQSLKVDSRWAEMLNVLR
ncbi:hypothetical protein acsn021_37470 [Anaerocolumna cellulosilytica]|uniref:Uncharacterized protein n=1 Tax=Anaerocolumna cellulosilytica TaxID=433286 RepID=A0A6S6RBA3_9FIRM|nr:GNAT family N-acetyltransferase [Anaerocolumna cellulosilytica]MBB5194986.1 RimJ/RimL family protein N-acetyltransferase [Anaerocolumna cellulosilytica]BCJ96178.1 hypothetical protein acsn021_37470 [Anaerocolumna cellulosilytica]